LLESLGSSLEVLSVVGSYVDLSIRPKSLDDLKEMITVAERLGFSVVGLGDNEYCRYVKFISKTVRVVCRIEVTGDSRSDIARKLSRLKSRSDTLIVAIARNLDVARYAAVKKTIDIVRVEPEAYNAIDWSEATLLREKGWGLIEISLKHVLEDPEKYWRSFSSALRRAYRYDVTLALVTDAENSQELLHPRVMAGIASLAGIPGNYALSYVSSKPLSILKLKKLV